MRHCPQCNAEFAADRADCSDCGGTLVDGPSPRFDADAAPASPVPSTGPWHCPSCAAEFETHRDVCADCGTALVHGPSPLLEGTAADDPLRLEDFVALVTLRTGQAADALGDRLAEAGIATVVTGSAGIRMHAPGRAPIGPLNAGTVDVGVFPEDLERASEMLAEWPAQDAIVDDDEPSPASTSDGEEPARSASRAPQSTSPIAVVLLIAALGVMVAAWMLSTAR